MYKREDRCQLSFEDFYLPFGGKLKKNNRWIIMSQLIPWDEFEEKYAENFADSGMGAPAKSFRMALGALLIKEKLHITDEETVEQISENPYMQYLIGRESYSVEEPFDASMMVHFRSRIDDKMLREINERIHERIRKKTESKEEACEEEVVEKKGKLLIDATCAPSDIHYPTDLSLLNESREKLEKIIDVLHKPLVGKKRKCRTYRRKARYEYLKIAKRRRVSSKEMRKAIGKQLGYVRRDLGHIERLVGESSLSSLSKRQYRDLLVVQEVYRQQRLMYERRNHSVEGRIVSISQPHIRPIVRGKVSAPVEFGAKISVSVVGGWIFLDRLSWEPYHEGLELKEQVERYRRRYGYYPESVHADKTYRNRENRAYCKRHNIRLSGPPLGRRKKDGEERRYEAAIRRQDERDRIPVEGKFGNGKRRYGLGRIMAKRAMTSESSIGTIILVMNLEKILRYFLFAFFYLCWLRKCRVNNPKGAGVWEKYLALSRKNSIGEGTF